MSRNCGDYQNFLVEIIQHNRLTIFVAIGTMFRVKTSAASTAQRSAMAYVRNAENTDNEVIQSQVRGCQDHVRAKTRNCAYVTPEKNALRIVQLAWNKFGDARGE